MYRGAALKRILILGVLFVPLMSTCSMGQDEEEDLFKPVTHQECAQIIVREIMGEKELPIAATIQDYYKFLELLVIIPIGGWRNDETIETSDIQVMLKLEEMGRVVKRDLELTLEAPQQGEAGPDTVEVPNGTYADNFEIGEDSGKYSKARMMWPPDEEGKERLLVLWRPRSEKQRLGKVIVEEGNYPFFFTANAATADVTVILKWLEHTTRPINIAELLAILRSQIEIPFILPQFLPQISPGSPRLED